MKVNYNGHTVLYSVNLCIPEVVLVGASTVMDTVLPLLLLLVVVMVEDDDTDGDAYCKIREV